MALVLKKSPSWCLRGRQQQGYKQTRVSDAAGNRHSRRLAAYDGATRPFGVAVLLLPHRRSGSSKPLVTFNRPLRQLRFCACEVACILQRNVSTDDRTGSAVTEPASGILIQLHLSAGDYVSTA